MTAQTPSTETRSTFFGRKRFAASLRAGGREFEVQVTTPDLTQASTTMWGDWGPMYTCSVDVDRFAEVRYRDTATGEEVTRRFSPPTVAIHAPADAAQRKRLPFRIELVDAARGLKLRGWMNADGEVEEAEVVWIHTSIDVPNLIFRPDSVAVDASAANDRFSRAG
jgi:hypothetical protein